MEEEGGTVRALSNFEKWVREREREEGGFVLFCQW